MSDITKVLLATDFSGCAHAGLKLACQFAEKFEAELHVVHVVHNLSVEVPEFGMGLAFPGYLENIASVKHELAVEAQKALTEEVDKYWKESHRVKFAILFGVPDVEIVAYANRNDIDHIVMGTHGRTGLSHVLLGSVAERVIERANCPVTTIRSK